MKAYELMVGDFVIVNGILRQVSQITKHKIGYHKTEQPFGECKMSYARLYEIKPVPLTSEILEKNGFERKVISDEEPYYQDEEGNSYYQYGELGINTPHIWFWYKDGHITMPSNCTKWIEFSSVHELQHILRSCNLITLADNFKI